MSVTIDEAAAHLNVPMDSEEIGKIRLFTDAANEWIANKITDTSPAVVKLATLFLLEHFWESQRGPAFTPLAGDEMVEVDGTSYSIPNRVLELIHDYRVKATPTGSFPDAPCWPEPAGWPA